MRYHFLLPKFWFFTFPISFFNQIWKKSIAVQIIFSFSHLLSSFLALIIRRPPQTFEIQSIANHYRFYGTNKKLELILWKCFTPQRNEQVRQCTYLLFKFLHCAWNYIIRKLLVVMRCTCTLLVRINKTTQRKRQ